MVPFLVPFFALFRPFLLETGCSTNTKKKDADTKKHPF